MIKKAFWVTPPAGSDWDYVEVTAEVTSDMQFIDNAHFVGISVNAGEISSEPWPEVPVKTQTQLLDLWVEEYDEEIAYQHWVGGQ